MYRPARAVYLGVIVGGVSVLALATGPGFSEPVLNQVLSGAKAIPAAGTGCPSIRIGFNFRVRYVSHFPLNGGTELRIKVRPLDLIAAGENIKTPRESVRAPNLPGAGIRDIEFEANGSGPLLIVYFDEPATYSVAQGNDFTSISLRVAGPGASEECRASLAMRPSISDSLVAADAQPSKDATMADMGKPDDAKIDVLMGEARTAIAKKDYRRATQLLTKLIGYPPHKHSAEAQELLGVVREHNGQMAHAKAEYETYLKKYPKGEGAARVRQRLAAIATADAEPPQKLRKAGTKSKGDERLAANTNGETVPAQTDQAARAAIAQADQVEDPTAFKWEVTGSLSQFYFFNQEFTRLTEFESRRKTEDDDVFQNSLLTSVDLIGLAENDAYRFKFRFSGAHDADFVEDTEHDFRASAVFAEVELKEVGTLARVGRQTRNTGGILGRFDGGLLSWQATETTRLNLAVGSPVDSSRDEPFLNDRVFYNASVDFEDVFGGWDMTLFAIEQRAVSLVDRRALGAELRYADEQKYFFGTIDYDIYFNRVNSGLLTGSYTFGDDSTISGSVDYVHSPSLSTSNALQGQSVDSLDALRNIFTVPMIKELALDRTTETKSANLAYSRPLNDMWQVTVDGTVFHTSGNPASGGVAAVEAPGAEYFASAQLVGAGVFKEGDIVSATVRYANTASTDLYLLDAYTRFPVTKELRLRPRVKVGYRDLKKADGTEVFVIPSLTANYKWTDSTSFEVEVGGRWSTRETTLSEETSQEFYVIGGYRYDF